MKTNRMQFKALITSNNNCRDVKHQHIEQTQPTGRSQSNLPPLLVKRKMTPKLHLIK